MSTASTKYSRWDGSQDPFPIDPKDIIDELANDVMNSSDITQALRRLMQRGMQSRNGRMEGMKDLMERLKQRKQQQLQRYDMDSIVDDLKKRLEQIMDTERKGIDKRLQEAMQQFQQGNQSEQGQKGQSPQGQEGQNQQGEQGQQGQGQRGQGQPNQKLLDMLKERAARSKEKLDKMPKDLGGQIKELSSYDFMDHDARQQFQELIDMLKKRMMENHFRNMSEMMKNMTPEQMKAIQQMIRDMNKMLQDHMAGRDPHFNEFMDKWGQMFGDDPPKDIDDLIERMQRQMAQMQNMMDSMSPEMRQEMEDMMQQMMGPGMQADMEQLAATLDMLFPADELRQQYQFSGQEPLSMQQAMQLMEDLQKSEDLERQLEDVAYGGDIDDINSEEMANQAGEDARRILDQLKRMQKELEDAGYIRRKGDKLELTPKAMRRIGQKALKDIFEKLKKDRNGSHEQRTRGAGGEELSWTKKYEFGDEFKLDLQQTMRNSLVRNGPGTPVKFKVDDFEVKQTEHLTSSATVLLLDQSRSMAYNGSFPAAKKVAVALHSLMTSQFTRDHLYILGFSDVAVEIKGKDLPEITWNSWMHGTNMHHAFMMSRKMLAKHKGATKQIIMITDGEPTAHLENGRSYFSYPPDIRTISETLKEVYRCTREGITINTFMLETSYYLIDFIGRLTKINHGRAFYTTPDKLGEYILVDFLKNRRKKVA